MSALESATSSKESHRAGRVVSAMSQQPKAMPLDKRNACLDSNRRFSITPEMGKPFSFVIDRRRRR
jgi:hypothetical protein